MAIKHAFKFKLFELFIDSLVQHWRPRIYLKRELKHLLSY